MLFHPNKLYVFSRFFALVLAHRPSLVHTIDQKPSAWPVRNILGTNVLRIEYSAIHLLFKIMSNVWNLPEISTDIHL